MGKKRGVVYWSKALQRRKLNRRIEVQFKKTKTKETWRGEPTPLGHYPYDLTRRSRGKKGTKGKRRKAREVMQRPIWIISRGRLNGQVTQREDIARKKPNCYDSLPVGKLLGRFQQAVLANGNAIPPQRGTKKGWG